MNVDKFVYKLSTNYQISDRNVLVILNFKNVYITDKYISFRNRKF